MTVNEAAEQHRLLVERATFGGLWDSCSKSFEDQATLEVRWCIRAAAALVAAVSVA
jgi:hypothetical protein